MEPWRHAALMSAPVALAITVVAAICSLLLEKRRRSIPRLIRTSATYIGVTLLLSLLALVLFFILPDDNTLWIVAWIVGPAQFLYAAAQLLALARWFLDEPDI